jgi:hypothetical protein
MEHFEKEKYYSLSRQYAIEGTVSWGPPFSYSDYMRRSKEHEFQTNERYLRHQLAIRHGVFMDSPLQKEVIQSLLKREHHSLPKGLSSNIRR